MEKREHLKQHVGFPDSSVGKESACNTGDPSSVPGLGRSPGEGKGYSLQYSGPEKSMDCVVHEVTKRRARLSDFHFHFQYSIDDLIREVNLEKLFSHLSIF